MHHPLWMSNKYLEQCLATFCMYETLKTIKTFKLNFT